MKLIAHLSENLCKVIPCFLKFGRILGIGKQMRFINCDDIDTLDLHI